MASSTASPSNKDDSSSSSLSSPSTAVTASSKIADKAKAATETTTSASDLSLSSLRVTFLHLDLGIGGAEQLVLQLALATTSTTNDNPGTTSSSSSSSAAALAPVVEIVTTRCDPTHSFAEFKPPDGVLYQNVKVVGRWIAPNIMGYGTALCSTLRMIYLSLYVIWTAYWNRQRRRADDVRSQQQQQQQQQQHVLVLDVLPTSIPLLRYCLPKVGILFYCHFPDKLLTRNTVNGEEVVVVQNNPDDGQQPVSTTTSPQRPSFLARLYRSVLNGLEEYTLNAAHVICVNSKFTKATVQREFPTLRQREMDVLYPAISTPIAGGTDEHDNVKTSQSPIVSLNRFERKKNVELLLRAYAELRRHYQESSTTSSTTSTATNGLQIPKVIIAGGYDPTNVENIEYMGELRRLTNELKLEPYVEFCPSISDHQRTHLLQTALCVVYTPHLEHFGIVPLESMLAGTPVVCVKSGGPLETVVDGVTGYLRDATPLAFAQALQQLVDDPNLATTMGRAGVRHVQTKFGTDRFRTEWHALLRKTVTEAHKQQALSRRQRRYSLWNSATYLMEAILALLACVVLTWFLKRMGWLDAHESILGKLHRTLWTDEL